MTITSPLEISFLLYLVTASNAIRARGNTTSDAIFVCFLQMGLGQVATSYIPTNGTRVTRAADMVQYDVFLSLFRLYGVRDFIGPTGRRRLLGETGQQGIQGIQGIKEDTGEQGIQGLKGDTEEQGIQAIKRDTGEQGIQGIKGDTGQQGIQGRKGDT
jgi:hypothetical protein